MPGAREGYEVGCITGVESKWGGPARNELSLLSDTDVREDRREDRAEQRNVNTPTEANSACDFCVLFIPSLSDLFPKLKSEDCCPNSPANACPEAI